MKAGRELDALMAEKVMGWRWFVPLDKQLLPYWTNRLDASGDDFFIQPEAAKGTWSPSTSIAAAWEVEAKIGEGYDSRICFDHPPNARVYEYLTELHRLVGHPIDYESSFDADWALVRATPEQRCLAALKACEVEVLV